MNEKEDKEKKRNIERIKHYLSKEIPAERLDSIDFPALYDSSLSYEENLEMFKDYVNYPKTEKEQALGSLAENKKECLRIEGEVIDNINQRLNQITQEGEDINLDKFFKIPIKMLDMIAQGFTHAVMFLGQAGAGKSYTILKTLKKAGLNYGEDFVMISGCIPPLEFYKKLYEYSQKKIIVLDDVEGLFNNPRGKSILKGCLDNSKGISVVSYYGRNMEVPTKFETEARFIICSNTFPNDADFQAVKDRCFFYSFEFTYNELLEMMNQIVRKPYKNTTLEDRKEILNWLQNSIKPYHDNFSLRTLNKSYDAYLFDKNDWKEIVLTTVKENRVKKIIYDLDKNSLLLKEMFPAFKEQTGKSYRTFLRLRKKMGLNRYEKI